MGIDGDRWGSMGIWTGDIDACTPAENFVTVIQTIAVKE